TPRLPPVTGCSRQGFECILMLRMAYQYCSSKPLSFGDHHEGSMINPVYQKSFLDKLFTAGSMTLAEAVALLSPAKAPKFDEISAALQFLWTEDLFTIHKENSAEELWL